MNATCISGTQNQVKDEVLWRKNGSSFPVEYSSTPIIKDGKVMGAVVTFRDITERKKARKELEERMEDLERFSRLTIDREEKMIQLKEEINNLLEQTGGEKKYKIVA
jgi:transcriptional regulator with PAS, ATPase and Fis domain